MDTTKLSAPVFTAEEKMKFAETSGEILLEPEIMKIYETIIETMQESGCPIETGLLLGLGVAAYGAAIATASHATALGIDPAALRLTDEEATARFPTFVEGLTNTIAQVLNES